MKEYMDIGKNNRIMASKSGMHILSSGLRAFDWEYFKWPKEVHSLKKWRYFRDLAMDQCGGWSDKDSAHNYLETYWQYTKGRDMNVNSVLEIGIKYGHSLCIWDVWFGSPEIIGVDILLAKNHKPVDSRPFGRAAFLVNLPNNISLIECDILKYTGLDEKKFDVIIDDGSHIPEQQMYVLNKFYKNLNKNGALFIEDIYSREVVDDLYNNFIGNKENLFRHCGLSEHIHRRPGTDIMDKDSNILVYINR